MRPPSLNLALGRDLGTPMALPADVELDPPAADLELAALVAAARDRRPDLRAARQRLEQSARGVRLAERSLEIIEDRYREGLTVLTELLDAQNALTRARLRRLGARRDVLLARASLDLATGNL